MSPNLIRHIGLIPDGGRRWASRQKVPLSASYELSVRKIATFSDRFFSDDITSISIYLASTLNLEKRGEDELISLFYALDYMFLDLLPEVCHKWHAQIGVAGLRTNLSYEASLES
jgi:undecaprenyl pyrophosphate synthase